MSPLPTFPLSTILFLPFLTLSYTPSRLLVQLLNAYVHFTTPMLLITIVPYNYLCISFIYLCILPYLSSVT